MTLESWLKENGRTVEQFAVDLGVKRQTVHRYISGDRFPRPEIIDRISEATSDQVTVVDWHSGRRKLAA